MSDGPHRSLPLKRHWKKFAERAATPSFSLGEVADALPNAIMNDFKEAPVSQVLKIFLGEDQISLFHQDCTELLEAVRGTCRGSTVGITLIDCAIEANANGLTGSRAVETAFTNALEAYARGTCHSIEEHYQRKNPLGVINVRDRLRTACGQVSFAIIASKMLTGKASRTASFRLQKRTGLDEGPQL